MRLGEWVALGWIGVSVDIDEFRSWIVQLFCCETFDYNVLKKEFEEH